MKKFYSAGMILILLLVTIFTGCGSNSDDPNPTPTVLFSDNFDAYDGGTWILPEGWTNHMLTGPPGNCWNVATDGSQVLEVNSTNNACVINAFNGNNGNYKISAKIKFAAITLGGAPSLSSEMGVIGRAQDEDHFYLASVCYYVHEDLNPGGAVTLSLMKYNIDDDLDVSTIKSVEVLQSGSPDTNIFYTLTLTVNGSTITGNISGGTGGKALNETITATDDTFSGAEIGGGKVGLYIANHTDVGGTPPISHLDDFVVTTP